MKTDIEKKIKDLIYKDLEKAFEKEGDSKETVWKYRDDNFLGGQYDHIFINYIEVNDLK